MNETNDNEIYGDLLPDEALAFGPDFSGEVKHSEIAYICDHVYPFLQIASPEHNLANLELNVIEAKNGWKIIDYGEILSTAALHDKSGNFGKGTIVKQQFDVAFEMMELIRKRHWGKSGDGEGGEGALKPTSAQILGGTPMMQRFAWFAAEALGIKLDGFAPTAEDQKWLELLYHRHAEKEKAAGMGKIMNNE